MHGKKPKILKRKDVKKPWGKETWLVNNKEENYCSKLLYVYAGKEFSMHFHVNKHETFVLMEGKATLSFLDTKEGKTRSFPMEEGKVYEIPRLVPHRVIAEEDSVILEVSTFHEDTDSHRCYR